MEKTRYCFFHVNPPIRNGEAIGLNLGLFGSEVVSVEVSVLLGDTRYPLNPNIRDLRHVLNVISKNADANGQITIFDPTLRKKIAVDVKAINEVLRFNISEVKRGLAAGD